MKIYQAIGAVSAAMSQDGIGKNRKNDQQGYKFRGIDDVLNALSTALVEAGLVILPRCVERVVVERTTSKGGAIFNVTCKVEFDLVSTEDGSAHMVTTYGEAMDSADKATNKAMSAAYKYLALLVFCIPTEATPDNDADFSTHDIAKRTTTEPVRKIGVVADIKASMPELSAEDSMYYKELGWKVEQLASNGKIAEAFNTVKAENLDNDQTIHLWACLPSNVRSALKAEGNLRIGAA